MRRRDFTRHLGLHGCQLLREGGRHSIFLNPANRKRSAVPRHNELNDITVRKICQDLGIPPP